MPHSASAPVFPPPLRLRRPIQGWSAILLPFQPDGAIDWAGFESHIHRTLEAGLAPAVNMDTGYANLIDEDTRDEVLCRTQKLCAGRNYAAGAFVKDAPGAAFNPLAYRQAIEQIVRHDGTPVIFQSFGLSGLADADLVAAYRGFGAVAPRFIGFELGTMFAPFGRIYPLEVYARLMEIPQHLGAKHSSLSRVLEWQRLELRDRTRPDFHVFTGNDLAIDMVMYGSDYLLGLSTFDPAAFALRDRWWAEGDVRFYELNDLLQYLGFLAFRNPVPGYKHNAAQFLHGRGWIASDRTHPHSPHRPDSDRELLQDISRRLEQITRSH